MHILTRCLAVLTFSLCLGGNALAAHWFVQAGAFGRKEVAVMRQHQVRSLVPHHPVEILDLDQTDKVLYTVRVLHIESENVAMEIKKQLLANQIDAFARPEPDEDKLYNWWPHPGQEEARVEASATELDQAYAQPEKVIRGDIKMPIAPDVTTKKIVPMSLRDAILLLLRYNPDVQGREIDRIVDRYALRVAQNEFELQYALTGSYAYSHSRVAGVTQPESQSAALLPSVTLLNGIGTQFTGSLDTTSNMHSVYPQATFSLNQPLLRGFGSEVTQTNLNNTYDQEVINQLALKDGIINDVVTVINAYRQYISANNQVLIQKQSLADAIKTYDNNAAKIKAGQLESGANVQQSSQIEQLRLALTSAINNAEQLKQTLLQNIGLDPAMNIQVPDNVDIGNPKAPDTEKTIEYALKHNASYQEALIQFRITQRALTIAEDNLRWQLNFTASTTYGSSGGTGGDAGLDSLVNGRNSSQSLGLQLTVPINDLQTRSAVISAKLAVEKARINLAALKRALITNIRNQTRDIVSQIEQVKISIRSLALAEQSYELEKKKRLAGISSSLDVTNSQNQLINARVALINAKIGYLNAATALSATLGTTLNDWQIELRY